MTAAEVKERLRRRHPAVIQRPGYLPMVGPWTCVEELYEIDMLALCANRHAAPATRAVSYPIVGYEVKVSRGDYRSELLKPYKRVKGRSRCHEFYFAVPKGLLKPHEIEYVEPEWEPEDFMRVTCPDRCHKVRGHGYSHYIQVSCPWPRPAQTWREVEMGYVPCETCGGKGYIEKSRVEKEAPTLWVPKDVGLIEVSSRGCHVTKRSPVVKEPEPFSALGVMARWISVRPDPRHRSLSDAAC